MSHLKNPRLMRLATLATAILAGATIFAVATTARGASHRAQAAAIDLTQTCSTRVEPGATIEFSAMVRNSGDQQLDISAIDADAATPENAGDDIDLKPLPHSGDTNNNGFLDVGEEWTYSSSYTAPAGEDVTNIVGVDATSASQESVSDIAPCETDVVQQAQPGQIAGVKEVAGTVLIKEPGGKFVPLNGQTEIPIGSQINTLQGTVLLTAGLGGGKTNSGDFSQGIFTILQAKKAKAFMTLKMVAGNFGVCRGGSAQALSIESAKSAAKKKRVRRLFGSAKGRFTTRGRASSATVEGTKWLVEDRCDGTFTKVIQGVVKVKDFRKHKTFRVRTGHSYFARS